MTVYALVRYEPHEGGCLLGVYSSQEKARDEAPEPDGFHYWVIHPVQLDAAATPVSVFDDEHVG